MQQKQNYAKNLIDNKKSIISSIILMTIRKHHIVVFRRYLVPITKTF